MASKVPIKLLVSANKTHDFRKWQLRRMPNTAETLDPVTAADLVSAAFDKSWQFVRTDPALAHSDMDEMRIRLSRRLMRLAQDGERDMLRLANGAIGQLRREQRAA